MFSFLKKIKNIYEHGKEIRQAKYKVISHEDNYENTGKIFLKVQIQGTSKVFYRPVEDLYQKNWLEDFSKEDAAFIAVLFTSEKSKSPEIIKYFPRKKYLITKHVVFLGMMFISFLILSNLTASKLVSFNLSSIPIISHIFSGEVNLPAALVFFPLTYFIDDALTEVYGFRISRFVIWSGILCNSIVSLGIGISIQLTPAHVWAFQHEYESVLGATYLIFMASMFATVLGEFVNAMILSKIKVLTSGKWLWLRIITSSSCGVAVDSIIFCTIAFWGKLPNEVILGIIMAQYIFKITYEVLALPFTYLITGYLKRKDNINFYDYSTSYNPFSLKLHD